MSLPRRQKGRLWSGADGYGLGRSVVDPRHVRPKSATCYFPHNSATLPPQPCPRGLLSYCATNSAIDVCSSATLCGPVAELHFNVSCEDRFGPPASAVHKRTTSASPRTPGTPRPPAAPGGGRSGVGAHEQHGEHFHGLRRASPSGISIATTAEAPHATAITPRAPSRPVRSQNEEEWRSKRRARGKGRAAEDIPVRFVSDADEQPGVPYARIRPACAPVRPVGHVGRGGVRAFLLRNPAARRSAGGCHRAGAGGQARSLLPACPRVHSTPAVGTRPPRHPP
eukprot:scaffold10272_cov124-Isochrysis_galbana.AAC.1